MEASVLTGRDFWNDDSPVLMGGGSAPPSGLPGLVFFRTSGSSGEPKWIGLSRQALQVSARAVNDHLGVTTTSAWALALPLEHVGGFGVVARAWQARCRLARFEGKWQPRAFVAWLEHTRPSHLSLVPTQVHDLVAGGLRAPASLQAVVVGGGSLPEAAGRAARDLGWPVLASYGMTEAGSQIATQGLDLLGSPYVPRPIGLLPCWDARIDGEGRILIRGEALFSGVLRDGMRYQERGGEWHTTSDTGELAGRALTVTGRADLRVKILGELVDPLAVEHEIAGGSRGELPADDIVVVALEDGRAGHRLVLVHDQGVSAIILARALEAYHASCPGFRRIVDVVEVARIPRGSLGKPRRAELARLAAERRI